MTRELRRVLGSGKLWLLLAFLLALNYVLLVADDMQPPTPDASLYDTELAGLSASMEGPITEQTVLQIQQKIDDYKTWAQDGAITRQIELLTRMREKAEESLRSGDGLWFINQAPTAALLLPACMSYIGVSVFDNLCLLRLFSPLECSIAVYCAAAFLLAALLILSRLLWPRRKA